MAIQPLSRQVILHATEREFEAQAVLNPTCIEENGIIHMFYRAVRPGNYSSIGYAQLKDDEVVYRAPEPILSPEKAYERHGLEDPRLVKLDGIYYLFYTVYDGIDAQVAYATAQELPHFTKQGIISPKVTYGELRWLCQANSQNEAFNYLCSRNQIVDGPADEILLWEKDAFIFPKLIKGRKALVHRVKPEIQVLYFDEFADLNKKLWLKHLARVDGGVLLNRIYWFENGYIGGGAPPLETEHGWLFIYHAVEQTESGAIYRAAVALLDLNDPSKVLARLDYPLFSPDKQWERFGDVNNVVFPTAILLHGEEYWIYYGAADKVIAKVAYSRQELINELLRHAFITEGEEYGTQPTLQPAA